MLNIFDDSGKVKFKTMIFSGGEINVTLDYVYGNVEICAEIHSANELMELVLVVDAIRRQGGRHNISLVMPYIPYARQDRVCNAGESLSLKVFCDMINSLNFTNVRVCDPHSDVAPALLNNVEVISQEECIDLTIGMRDFAFGNPFKRGIALVSPDAGANKKTFKVAKEFKIEKVIRADKIRDVSTGNILETVVYCEHLGNQDVLIVDDICDGGRTFIELAKILRTKTDGKIMLYVTHGIFSKGFEVFDGIIDKIFCFRYFGTERPSNENVVIRNVKGEF